MSCLSKADSGSVLLTQMADIMSGESIERTEWRRGHAPRIMLMLASGIALAVLFLAWPTLGATVSAVVTVLAGVHGYLRD